VLLSALSRWDQRGRLRFNAGGQFSAEPPSWLTCGGRRVGGGALGLLVMLVGLSAICGYHGGTTHCGRGEIGRRARFRSWYFGVQVQVLSPAQGSVRSETRIWVCRRVSWLRVCQRPTGFRRMKPRRKASWLSAAVLREVPRLVAVPLPQNCHYLPVVFMQLGGAYG
jgi:hypothetical protein